MIKNLNKKSENQETKSIKTMIKKKYYCINKISKNLTITNKTKQI